MGALEGLLVVAIEQAVAAPTCTVRLADAGARVIKIERKGGETARHYDKAVKGFSAYFAWLNRGKESAELDLKSKDGLRTLRKMLEKADVLVQNLIPGALGRMGFTSEVLEREFPRLIAVSIVGYGQDTPYADMRAYDLLVQAESGLCDVTGTTNSPAKLGISGADIGTGMNAHAAILEALIERGRTGEGKQIEIAMFDGMADWMSVPLLHNEGLGAENLRGGLTHASIYPYGPFECADGTIMVAVQTGLEWTNLCQTVLQRPDLEHQPEFATNVARSSNRKALDEIMNPIFKKITMEAAIGRLEDAGVAYARYSKLDDLGVHPALRRTDVTLPNGQIASMPRPAGRTSTFTPARIPDVGEHTAAIMKEFG